MQVLAVSFLHDLPKATFVVLSEGKRITLTLEWVGKPLELPDTWEISLEGEIANAKALRELKALGRWVP